jgi:hypothetical protein
MIINDMINSDSAFFLVSSSAAYALGSGHLHVFHNDVSFSDFPRHDISHHEVSVIGKKDEM